MRAIGLAALLMASPVPALAQGAILESYEQLRQAPVLEATRAALPASADVSALVPPPRNQGPTASCVSWAVTYGAASQALRRAGRDGMTLSPGYTYNAMAADATCQTSTSISKTLDLLKEKGALPLAEFAFDGGWCGRVATAAEVQRAAGFRIPGWKRINAKDLDLVKSALSRGMAVIFAMRPGPKLYGLKGDGVFDEIEEPGRGHAMLVVGYDDAKKAFRIQNSAGTTWGSNGYGWFGYEFWKRNVDVGFVIN